MGLQNHHLRVISCLLCHFWVCKLLVEAKRLEHQLRSQSRSSESSSSGHCLSLEPLLGMRVPKLDLKKGQWEDMSRSGFQGFTTLVGVWIAKLDPEKTQWEVTTSSALQVFTSFVGVRAPMFDPKKSQWEVTNPSGLQVFTSLVGKRASKLGGRWRP